MTAAQRGWEPDPEELRAVRDYLLHQPEQGDWEWADHCDGLAGGILQALHVLATKRATTNPARPPAGELSEPERQRFIAQARRHGQTIEALRAQLSDARSDAREDYARAETAEQALVTARADVARLTAECADWARLHDQTARLCARCSTVLTERNA